MGPEVAVGEQQRHRARDDRQREDQQHRVGEDRPAEQGQAAPAHAGRPHVRDRRVEVHGADERGDAREVDQEDPGVDAAGGQVVRRGQRRVAGPAALGRGEEDRAVEDEAAHEQHPEAHRVELREGHVPGADHQRHEVVAEPGHDRHDEQEDHRRPVHREELVVRLRRQQRVVRLGELQADEQRLDAAQHEEHEGEDQVHDPDLLVVRRGHPRRPPGVRARDLVRDDLRQRGEGGRGRRRGDERLRGHGAVLTAWRWRPGLRPAGAAWPRRGRRPWCPACAGR